MLNQTRTNQNSRKSTIKPSQTSQGPEEMGQDNKPNNRSKEQAPKGTATENQQLTAAKPKEMNNNSSSTQTQKA